MIKISAVAPKNRMEEVVEELYSLGLMDIDDTLEEIDNGEPLEGAEEISKTLVDIRSLISKLPETEKEPDRDYGVSDIQESIERLKKDLEDFDSEKTSLESELQELKDKKQFFESIKGSGVVYEDLEGTRQLDVFVGKLEQDIDDAPSERYEILKGEKASVALYDSSEEKAFLKYFNKASTEQLSIPEGDYEGTPDQIVKEMEEQEKHIRDKVEGKDQDIRELSREWLPALKDAESFLTEKVEKAEAPLKFGTTEKAFITKGWIPEKRYTEVKERLAQVTEGRIHVEKEDTQEEPPVKHDNPSIVQPFESLSDLIGTPKHDEIDPALVIFLTFPLFFGFMIGDMGYGLTTFLVFYGGMKMFPQAGNIFKSLMFASVSTFIFGAVFGDMFGYVAFGSHSEIAAATGLHFLEQIPIVFHRAEHLGSVFMISAALGVAHINAGYLIGFYNEHVKHGFKEAFLEKGSWMLLEAGAVLAYFYGTAVGGPVMAISVLMLFLGEGIEGIVEIPSLVSNILSYLRIFGVSVAAISLAKVVNGLATPFFQSGSLIGVIAGLLFLLFGHGFNTFIKIMEGFLQGIRLHYVEMFQKFYEGGGRKYSPFGAK